MPSATMASPRRASLTVLSSLWGRLRPVSDMLTISSTPDMSTAAVPSAGLLGAGLDIPGHLRAGLVAPGQVLLQGLVDDHPQAGFGLCQFGTQDEHILMRFVGDIVHERGHRFALERQFAGDHLVEHDAQRKQIGTAVDLLAGELL